MFVLNYNYVDKISDVHSCLIKTKFPLFLYYPSKEFIINLFKTEVVYIRLYSPYTDSYMAKCSGMIPFK